MSGKLRYIVSMWNKKTRKFESRMKFTSLKMIQRFYGDDFDLTYDDIERIYKYGDNFWKIEKLS